MEWTKIPGHPSYALIRGPFTATVEQVEHGEWIAEVRHRTLATVTQCDTLQEAQAWCLIELAKLHRVGEGDV